MITAVYLVYAATLSQRASMAPNASPDQAIDCNRPLQLTDQSATALYLDGAGG
jgi:hypothetical protein